MHRIVDGIATLSTRYDILLIGQSGVGKTSLIYKFIGESSMYHSQSQVEELHYIQVSTKTYSRSVPHASSLAPYQQISILDSTSLTEAYSSRKAQQMKNAKSILFAYSVSDRESFEALEYNIAAIQMITGDDFPPFVVAGLKLDMYHGYQVLFQEGEELASRYGARAFYEVSSQENRHVDEIFCPLIESVLRARSQSLSDNGSELLSMAEMLSDDEAPAREETASLTKPESIEAVALSSTLVTSLLSQKRAVFRDTRPVRREKSGCCVIV